MGGLKSSAIKEHLYPAFRATFQEVKTFQLSKIRTNIAEATSDIEIIKLVVRPSLWGSPKTP